MAPSPKRTALGRGLDSLISMDDTPARGTTAINEIPLSAITPNPEQPRTVFDEEALEELTQSVKEFGIIQPVSLRKLPEGGYQIIAGERRFRAASKAGLTSIPAYIREADPAHLTEMALIENIQREDLNAIEIALTYKKLLEDESMTQERLSERVGKKRATISNFLRLLKLHSDVQMGLSSKKIDMGHARALLSIPDTKTQLKVYRQILKEGLSVRKVEEIAKAYQEAARREEQKQAEKPQKRFSNKDFDILRDHLSQRFSTPVRLSCDASGKGKITFAFNDDNELQRLIAIFDTAKQ
ncbi:MAG: ParB/RepB/Spo0J family partition protein [Muribaculaceae bacterium]|nr:ParB/RepB/Spo0J family partition protein [Muribaculaceae bacterium]